MKHKHEGIPTLYRGIQFRSRLEAKWAAMFDLLEWQYEYEPFDLNGWIPDFLLHGVNPILVEVKPVTTLPRDIADSIAECEQKRELLICGCTCPVVVPPDRMLHWAEYMIALGWLCERLQDAPEEITNSAVENWWDYAIFSRWSNAKGRIGFCHYEGSFHDRMSGCYEGGHWGICGGCSRSEIKNLWSEAGNMTQWKGKRSVSR